MRADPDDRGHGGGLREFVVAGRQVVRHRGYVGYLLVAGSAMGAVFAYVAKSGFVLQSMSGLSPIACSIDFAANAAGLTLAALVAARLAGRVGLGGEHTAVPMATLVIACAAASVFGLLVLARGESRGGQRVGQRVGVDVPAGAAEVS